jgi:hypothetical protein
MASGFVEVSAYNLTPMMNMRHRQIIARIDIPLAIINTFL